MTRTRFHRISNEMSLLGYSLNMLSGPGLVAVTLISLVLLVIILTSPLDTFGTKLATLLFNLETFAPLLGIILFSGLLGADLGPGRLDNLQSSDEGIARVLLRKTLHGALFTAAGCLILLGVLRVVYTSFNIWWAWGIVVPATWYFGMLGLVVAAATRRALAGFTAGTALLLMAIAGQQVSPILLHSYSSRRDLVNLRLLGESNWLIAKIYFVVLALVLALLVLRMIQDRRAGGRGCLAAAVLIVVTSAGLHGLWARPVSMAAGAEDEIIDTRESGDLRRVRTAVSSIEKNANRRLERTLIREQQYTRAGDQWVFASDAFFHPSSEADLLHLDMVCDLDPDPATLTASVGLRLRATEGPLDRVFLFLAGELELSGLTRGGEAVAYTRRKDLLEVILPEPVGKGDLIELELSYHGPLAHLAEGVSEDFIALFDHWHPAVRDRMQNWVDPFTCRLEVRLPKPWSLAGARQIAESPGEAVFEWACPIPIHRPPLCAGVFREYEALYRDIPMTVHAFTFDEVYAQRLLAGCADVLAVYEEAFGPYPYPQLAFVEDRFQDASGVGHPGMMTMRADRTAREHEAGMFDLLLPHELAHQWWRLGLPKWLAEGAAVYSNYRYIGQRHGTEAATAFLDDSIYRVYMDSQSVMEPLVTDYRNKMSMYARGGYMFVALESVVGRDALAHALRTFLDPYYQVSQIDEEAVNQHLEQVLHTLVGPTLHSFVTDWMRSAKRFDPSVVEFQNTKSDSDYDIAVRLEHKGELQFPTQVRLHFADGTCADLTWPTGEMQTLLRHASSQPAIAVELDPSNRLLDWNRENNRAEASASPPAAPEDLSPSIARWHSYTTQDGLSGPITKSLLFGTDRRLYAGFGQRGWMSSRNWDLNTFDGQWRPLIPDPERGITILAMAQSQEGTLWCGGHGVLWRVRENEARRWVLKERRFGRVGAAKFAPNPSADSSIPGSDVFALLLDTVGNLWVGTDHGCSVHLAGDETWRHFSEADGLGARAVMALAEDADGVIWAGTSDGVYTCSGDRWTVHPGIAPHDMVLSIAIDANGAMWFGTYRHGMVALANGNLRRYTQVNSDLRQNLVSSLAFDSGGRLWFGGGAGLGCFDGETWTHFDQSNSGLPSSRIYRLVVDDSGHLWIGTDVGVTRYEL